MALQPEKKSRLHNWPDYVLFVVAAAFCVFSAKAFTRAPAAAKPATPPTKISRGLASVSSEQPVRERSTLTVDFSCQEEKGRRTKTEANLLRLTAESCGGRILRVTNQSTGESLMIFERNNGVSTHYFPLKEGANKILIEWKGAKKSATTIEVERS
jgi:hypothetical protein